jgi:hypothetical protein
VELRGSLASLRLVVEGVLYTTILSHLAILVKLGAGGSLFNCFACLLILQNPARPYLSVGLTFWLAVEQRSQVLWCPV